MDNDVGEDYIDSSWDSLVNNEGCPNNGGAERNDENRDQEAKGTWQGKGIA